MPRTSTTGKEPEARHAWRFRICLVLSVVVYLGLAYLSVRWLLGYPVVAAILVFFAAHSAAYLLVHETRGDLDDSSPPGVDEG